MFIGFVFLGSLAFRAPHLSPETGLLLSDLFYLEMEAFQFGLGYCSSWRVLILVEGAAHFEACPGRRRRDEVHDHLVTDERFAAPVLGDRREETVLDLVPLWQSLTC